jgi:pyruvate dehydrogenase E1 component
MSDSSRFDDLDPTETREWLESIDSVLGTQGPERAHFLLNKMIDFARRSGAYLPYAPNTAYLNTIATGRQPEYPGDRSIERRIEAYIRWNAMAMVVQANRESSEYGGHISSYASSATMYEVGFNHFWRAPTASHGGDMIFMQGHSSPGIYSRAYLEGRLREEQLAGLLAVPDGLDGSRPHDGDLPGTLHALSREPRDDRAERPQDLVLPGRRRDG